MIVALYIFIYLVFGVLVSKLVAMSNGEFLSRRFSE